MHLTLILNKLLLLLLHRRLGFGQESCAVSCRSFAHFNLLVDVCHCDWDRLVHLFNHLVALLQFSLNPTNRQLQKLVLSFGLNDLILKEVLVLLEGLGTRHPVFNLFIHLLLLILYLLPLAIHTVDLLVQVVDRFIFQRVVAIF